jgi:hypothetical protein
MKLHVVSASIVLRSKMEQDKLGSLEQSKTSGNTVLSVENEYCDIEEGRVKNVRKPRSEEITGGL